MAASELSRACSSVAHCCPNPFSRKSKNKPHIRLLCIVPPCIVQADCQGVEGEGGGSVRKFDR